MQMKRFGKRRKNAEHEIDFIILNKNIC